MLETIRPNQMPQLRRLGPTPRRPANQKPAGKLGEKGNEYVKEGEGTERLAPPRARRMSPKPTPSRPTLARPKKQDAPGAGSADGADGGNENLSSTEKLKNRTRPFRNGFLYSRIQ